MGLGFDSHQNHRTTTLELEMYLRCFGEVQRRVLIVVRCGKVGTVVDQKLYGGLRPSHEQGLDIPLVLPSFVGNCGLARFHSLAKFRT